MDESRAAKSSNAVTREQALAVLAIHATELRRRGVCHAALFGSVARGDATADSDIDILIELDPNVPIGVFGYVSLRRYIAELFTKRVDVVNRDALKAPLRRAVFAMPSKRSPRSVLLDIARNIHPAETFSSKALNFKNLEAIDASCTP
jgi:predicted nucleotidyltransferase